MFYPYLKLHRTDYNQTHSRDFDGAQLTNILISNIDQVKEDEMARLCSMNG
jgi:hypothetical protein